MIWLYLAIIAYFINAIAFIIDKSLLSESIPNPISYAFYVSILSAFVFLLLPFGIHVPPALNLSVAIVSGMSFFIALIYLYKSVKVIDVMEATSMIGVISAVATFILSTLLLSEHIAGHELVAFILLVIGTLLMSYFHLSSRVIIYVLVAGILFGFSYVTLKYFFTTTDFINGLFWTRLGMIGGAFLFLVNPDTRRQIAGSFSVSSPRSKFIFVFNKILAGAGFIILYYAIKIGSVVFVSAIQGLQFIFIIIIGAFLVRRMPMLFEKHIHERIGRKIIAAILIFAGLFFLFV